MKNFKEIFVGKSPSVVRQANTMTFSQAIERVIQGNFVTRLEWANENIYGYRKNEYLTIHLEDRDHQWLVNDGDMLADDWIIINK
jgi:hypothetical protein